MKTISNNSKKRCAKAFPYKGINKIIKIATDIIEDDINVAIGEFINDYDNPQLYNVMLFLLKDNYDMKELNKFDYVKKI